MERYCSTGQSPQRAVAPTEEEEEEVVVTSLGIEMYKWKLVTVVLEHSVGHLKAGLIGSSETSITSY
jgi:hypothetical protein